MEKYFLINPNHKISSESRFESSSKKRLFIKGAKQINKTDFFYFPKYKLGEGSFCKTFYALNEKTYQENAVKFFKAKKKNVDKFLMEKSMLERLSDSISFPSLYYCSLKDLLLIKSLHGPNLKKLFKFCEKIFPIRTTYYIGIEMISRLQEFHSKGFIHRDIKPSNFVWGKFSDSNNELKDHIFLIDYDLSYKNKSKLNPHISFQIEDSIVGNIIFKSINANDFVNQTRRDDLESVIYCLIYFIKGFLPWDENNINYAYRRLNKKILRKGYILDEENDYLISKERIIYEYKKCIPVKNLCDELPTEFELLIHYVRNLKYDEEPDYQIMKDS